jgi:hypothetical protein
MNLLRIILPNLECNTFPVCTVYAFQQAHFRKVTNVLTKLLTLEAVDGRITLSSSFSQIFH